LSEESLPRFYDGIRKQLEADRGNKHKFMGSGAIKEYMPRHFVSNYTNAIYPSCRSADRLIWGRHEVVGLCDCFWNSGRRLLGRAGALRDNKEPSGQNGGVVITLSGQIITRDSGIFISSA
jgi:hypothetical protein